MAEGLVKEWGAGKAGAVEEKKEEEEEATGLSRRRGKTVCCE